MISALGLIQRRRLAREAEAIFARLGLAHIDPGELVEDVSLAQRQIVEIVRAVLNEPAILFLDEPTSSLVEREVEWLFGLVRGLRARGVAILFTSHRWREVVRIADRITVFRNGRQVGTFTEIGQDEAVALMVGREVKTLYPPLPPALAGEPALGVRGAQRTWARRGLADARQAVRFSASAVWLAAVTASSSSRSSARRSRPRARSRSPGGRCA